MAIRNIRTDEDPILRRKSRSVETFDKGISDLVADMFETMYEAKGVGLAAPQVGILKRIFVIDDYETTKEVFINPTIEEKEGVVEGFEGCLSVPEKLGKVDRAKKIFIKYQDVRGKQKELEAEDFLARIVQHEYDHLEGVLYTDKAKEMFDTPEENEDESK